MREVAYVRGVMRAEDELLAEQIAYYRANARDYDRPYDTNDDLRELLATAGDMPISGDVLELACGTGQWTRLLAERARSVTAVDVAAETLEIARGRVTAGNVEFVQADVFGWRPGRRFDTVFFAFWLSHVPPSRMREFWAMLAGALRPRGRAVFIDDAPGGAFEEEVLAGQAVPTVMRRTGDGGRYRVVKVFHDARTLTDELATLGWTAEIEPVHGGYLSGVARPPTTPIA